ncbi:sulfatase-like hydrolase/transferase [Pseudoruegeria sp. SK021]|uniref:sulfatase-like hydrolase/transferase n=1 Tax=Pseudoruegeria sp. SK021 TaxID=1933035 RepID=UPI000A24EDAC|nr:sulfatase-like hydrolase/transferase [Pseudoruegeria sp. SK021]OSP55788.1 hypothetical protein BV911_05240 [Pseudoruegeria sp. SK021]
MTRNLLILMSDQHRRDSLGCAGHPVLDTPALDGLAARGTRFSKAYCNAPICVPSRASLATGLPIHAIPAWDNADPYHGQVPSFMHRARDSGAEVTAIGKLHFRSAADDNGFTEEISTMHVVNGTGTFTSLIRDPMPRISAASDLLKTAGAGETSYGTFDDRVRDHAVAWLGQRGPDAPPFVLTVSFLNPHPPYVAQKDLFDHYMAMDLPPPCQDAVAAAPDLPGIDGLRTYFDIDRADLSPHQIKVIAAAYYANITALDRRIAAVLAALEAAGLHDDTTVLYTSDHGEALGDHGLYGKCSMLEPSLGVPMILAGAGIPEGKVSETPVQLLDIYPTVLDVMQVAPAVADADRTGTSLRKIAAAPVEDRMILAQQHCAGVTSGTFALTDGDWKYIYAPDQRPMLFDLSADPAEARNLADHPDYAAVLSHFNDALHRQLDPRAVDAACKQSQHRRLQAAGGRDAILGRPLSAYTPAPDAAS